MFRRGGRRARIAVVGAAVLGVVLWIGLQPKSSQNRAVQAALTATKPQVTAPAVEPPRPESQLNAAPTGTSTTPVAESPTAEPAPATPPSEPMVESPRAEGTRVEASGGESHASRKTASASPRAAPAAPKADRPVETELPDPGSGQARAAKSNVDDEALQQALAQAAQRAKGCHVEGGPTGTVRVSVTFAPSGDVTGASVQGAAFTNTVEGDCIAAKFRGIHIPAFSGNDFVARKSVTIE
jgi:hypothetical protein